MNKATSAVLTTCILILTSEISQAATSGFSSLDEAIASTLRQRAKLTPPASSLYFGQAVSLSGNRAIVGAEHGSDGSTGSAFVFVQSGGTWSLEGELKPSDGVVGDSFGIAVSLSGTRALVGAETSPSNGHSGAAYTFVFDGTTWTQEAKLTPIGGQNLQHFGTSVSLAAGRALIGAKADSLSAGSAYVFTLRNGTWRQTARLTDPNGIGGDQFGDSVSLSGQRALIGAYGVANSMGSAYVYLLNGNTWTLEGTLTASDGVPLDDFGWSVSLSGDRAVIGAPYANVGALGDGAAYVFVFDGASWTQEAKLSASDPMNSANLGFSVSLSGLSALIAAPDASTGAAYLFAFDGTTWTQQQKLTPTDGVGNDRFGWSVFLLNTRAVIGARDQAPAGAAYIFAP